MGKRALFIVFILIDLPCMVQALPDVAEPSLLKTARLSHNTAEASSVSSCTLTRTNGNGVASLSFMEAQTGVFIYIDPAACGGDPYPYEITGFSYTLVDSLLLTWPLYLDIIVYDMAVPGDSCSGPGEILCHYAMYADTASFLYPHIGTFDFPDTCCVNGPFFIGIEFMAGELGWTPSMVYDDQTVPPCMSWFKSFGEFYEWTAVIPEPRPGYPLYWINGNTNAPDCGGSAPCDCIPGEANSDGTTNILDITYLIAYLYQSGPSPIPYSVCSGDPNGDCTVNILDISYMIATLYQNGPPPVDCDTWSSSCGPL